MALSTSKFILGSKEAITLRNRTVSSDAYRVLGRIEAAGAAYTSSNRVPRISHVVRCQSTALITPGPHTHATAMPLPSLGIPPSQPWEPLEVPSTPAELLRSLQSKSFQDAIGSPQTAVQVAYSTLRTAFFATQAILTAQSIGYKTDTGAFKDGVSLTPSALSTLATRLSPILTNIAELHRRDAENVRKGFYRPPYDMDPRHRQWDPRYIADKAIMFRKFAADVVDRRIRDGRTETQELSEEARVNRASYPDYYLQNFHFQDGWLSDFSAQTYEVATETIFTGSQDAMQRAGLLPLHFFMRGRSESATRFLDLACGTGRYLTFVRDNYPHMKLTGVDLSPFYLAKAVENDTYFREFFAKVNRDRGLTRAEFIAASAEALPMSDNSFDVVSCIYLFHELPPEARSSVVKEMARVVARGGIVILNDSTQRVDRPDYNYNYFPDNYHEPYYLSYVDTDLPALFAAHGFTLESNDRVHVSKVMCFRKT